ncbi:MAG: ASKHA domain-containing protein [Myxococcota bacterium]|nr:ASKHA domain-containing protein [Myxococcota bacterium]
MADESPDALVVFTPSGRRGRFPIGTALLSAARELGVDLDSVCGGRGICGRCKILLQEGEFATYGVRSTADHLSAISEAEERYARRTELAAAERLSCHAKIQGDCVVDVPASSQLHKQVVRKPYQSHDIDLDPIVRLYYVEVEAPRLEEPGGDLERLLQALADEWQLEDLRVDPHVLPQLQACLREGQWSVTVAVREQHEIVGVWPGFKVRILGVAVDVGTTTVAAHLCDLGSGEVLASSGVMNPQIRFGEDLMSRVSYVMLNPGGDIEMTRLVREAVDELVSDLSGEAGTSPRDVLEITLVANPIMHHLFLGISPIELGTAPFSLATDGAVTLRATELDLGLHPGARAYLLPCIAGHVGADTAAMLLAEAPWEDEGATLLVDVGTNAEIVLGGQKRLLAASSPTGPAFEGAQISCGQRATAGAVERVRIDPETLEPRFKVIGCEWWSDEQEFEAELGPEGVTGVCGTGIIEAVAELFLAGVIGADGRIDGSLASRTTRITPEGRTYAYVLSRESPVLKITQNDVRAIQLAKAALYAGVRLLMDRLGIPRVDRIRLAGAFGGHIDVKYAMLLGVIPDCDLSRVSSAGNAAGTGAVMALLSAAARREIETRVREVEKIETAVEAAFQEHFVQAMALPHATDPFPELARHTALPEFAEPGGQARAAEPTRRRRRRIH